MSNNEIFRPVEGTSRLSASLATGGLSPRQCLHRLLAEQPQALDGGAGSVWLNELIWREFLPSPDNVSPLVV
ncbi:deoxyribodipyrimidine photolyase, FAD-binding [Escherichia coli]|uniref:Deoxyribodipyrimidine photolyase, FAD-binding n=1 Tax=Escherichia coli TaxID=562 RepID=A0A377B3B7_ECOLX|nr:deoxyribodipyrimidine photolyase, FAD-binding [Escherichia coli]